MADKVYTSSCPDNPPEWYWVDGLHDACIIGVETIENPFDYDKFVKNNNKFIRNRLTLLIDAEGALYDSEVKEIRLLNYKVLSEDISLKGRKEIWWLADRLVDHGEYYTLEIDMQDFSSKPQDFVFKIKFESAEVIRD